jgi:hypothetical protein
VAHRRKAAILAIDVHHRRAAVGLDETVPHATLPDRQVTAVVMTSDGVELIGAVDFDAVEEGKLYVDMQQRRSMSGIVDDR